MGEQPQTVTCAGCEAEGTREKFFWMARELFCEQCIRRFESLGWVRLDARYAAAYEVTESGARAMPRLAVAAYCKNDGMRIYRGSIETGEASGLPDPVCPHCLKTGRG